MVKKRTLFIFLILINFVICFDVKCAVFDIYPVKIFLDSKNLTDKLTIKNVDTKDLSIQIRVYSWEQDDNGNDIYEETNDIVIFPKIVQLKPSEEKVIRIGCQKSTFEKEGTYRIMVEELPPIKSDIKHGATVSILLRVSIPVFLSPYYKKRSGNVEIAEIIDNKLVIAVSNTGNTHFIANEVKIRGLNKSGEEIISSRENGWYILPGKRKHFSFGIDHIKARELSKVQVVVRSDEDFKIERWIHLEN
ncbi:MAG: fimbria/pilus periplasmic chaperone [Deltaproteobacteria bacterium]|nr:fimbria/pilus periplasmic chaperone [Deltaproteobacteria bacterium]